MAKGYLFDNREAAETVAYITRACWDGCNGISEFKEGKPKRNGTFDFLSKHFFRLLPRAIIDVLRPKIDSRVLELAANLVEAEYCRIADSCCINSQKERNELALIQFPQRPKFSVLEKQILNVLYLREQSGLEIMDALRAKNCGLIKVNFGTLYPALRRLERKGLVSARWSSERLVERGYARRRFYRLGLKAVRFQQRCHGF